MGACFITATFKTTDEGELRKQYQKLVEQEQWDYGHSGYTGTFAEVPDVMIVADPFPSRKWTKKKKSDILDYLQTICIKWEAARAVKTSTGFIVAAWASE